MILNKHACDPDELAVNVASGHIQLRDLFEHFEEEHDQHTVDAKENLLQKTLTLKKPRLVPMLQPQMQFSNFGEVFGSEVLDVGVVCLCVTGRCIQH